MNKTVMAEKYFSPTHFYSFSWPFTTGNDPGPYQGLLG